MDVDSFIRKYRPDWTLLEEVTRTPAVLAARSGPELVEAVRLYLRVSGQLAEAQSRYDDPGLVAYLSSVVARGRAAIYGRRSVTVPQLARSATLGYRAAVRETAPYIIAAAVTFLVVMTASLLWVALDGSARAGLPDPLVQEVIRRAGGWRPREGLGFGQVSAFILVNNVRVALLGFALGVTAGVGSAALLVFNALVIGIVAGAAHAFGAGEAFWRFVVPHGLLELTGVFIAVGAGLQMGWALIEPGDRSRREALVTEGRRAAAVAAGVLPAFAVAALIEGYLSGTGAPFWLQLGVGVSVWAGYMAFLLWPARRGRLVRS